MKIQIIINETKQDNLNGHLNNKESNVSSPNFKESSKLNESKKNNNEKYFLE